MYILFFILVALYCLLTVVYSGALRHHTQTNAVTPQNALVPKFDRTILIPFRNEAAIIHFIIIDLKQQFESSPFLGQVILIDDHSEDNSANIVLKLIEGNSLFSLIKNEGQGKKAAIRTGIRNASYSRIVTLDADVRLSPNWLNEAALISDNFELNILPVELDSGRIIWFEQAEWQYLQGLTFLSARSGGALMCNGAHLEFSKALYESTLPNEHSVSSGDDMFVLEKAKEIGAVGFIDSKNFYVITRASANWRDFFSRRIRWASKNFKFKDKDIRRMGFLSVSSLLMSLLVLVISIGSNRPLLGLLLYFSLVWNNFYFVKPRSNGKNSRINLFRHLSFLVLLPLYTLVIGVLSFVFTPTWKGRKVNT